MLKRKTQTMAFRKPNASLSTVSDRLGDGNHLNPFVCTVNKMPANSDKKCSSCALTLTPLVACWLILLVVTGLRTFFTFVISENNGKLIMENQNLMTQNQNLMTQNKNLTEQIQNIKTTFARQCNTCLKGWLSFQLSCYAINNAEPHEHKTWEEARENCREKISDLAVVTNESEKRFVNDHSWGSSGTRGYWIGLRVEDGKWKWVDGSELTDNLWMQQPPANGHCAISVINKGWKSVSCKIKNQWICEKMPLHL